MKEAYGGIFNVLYISIFLVIVIGVLGLVVSYTKAFKMKNAIIATIEEYEGSGCYPEVTHGINDTSCRREIERKAKQLAYSPPNLNCSSDLYQSEYYCYSIDEYKKDDGWYATVTVVTQVDISFPIVEKIMGFRIFQVAGDTEEIKLMYK